MRKLLPLAALLLLAGCSAGPSEGETERRFRVEAQRREAAATQAAERERVRREFWQSVAYGAAVAAVMTFLAGIAIGSRSRHAAVQ